jgi:hypothetical protein
MDTTGGRPEDADARRTAGVELQSDEAFDRVASLRGLTGVTNEIRVDEPR